MAARQVCVLVAAVASGYLLARLDPFIESLIVPEPARLARSLLVSNFLGPSLHFFVRSGVADALSSHPGRSVEELAEQVWPEGTNHTEDSLQHRTSLLLRVLRFLTASDRPVIAEDSKHCFRLTPYGRYFTSSGVVPAGWQRWLLGGARLSCRSLVLTWHAPVLTKSRAELFNAVMTGKPGFQLAFGEEHETIFDLFQAEDLKNGFGSRPATACNPGQGGAATVAGSNAGSSAESTAAEEDRCEAVKADLGLLGQGWKGEVAAFDDTMTELARLLAGDVAASDIWSEFRSIADLGGASGALMEAIVDGRKPGSKKVKAFVLDLEQIVGSLGQERTEEAKRKGINFIAGSFRSGAPPPDELLGMDAVILKNVLHDWSNTDCAVILEFAKSCLADTGKLFIVENVRPSPPYPQSLWRHPMERLFSFLNPQFVLGMDLEMMVACKGRERTQDEWRDLLGHGSFRLDKVEALPGPKALSTFKILVASIK